MASTTTISLIHSYFKPICVIIFTATAAALLYYRIVSRVFFTTTLPPQHAALVAPIPTSRIPHPNPNYEWTVLAQIIIAARPAVCFAAIRDHDNWGEWNNWIPRIDIVGQDASKIEGRDELEAQSQLQLGTRFKVHVYMSGDGIAKIRAGKWGLSDVVRVVRCGALKDGRNGYTISWTNVSLFNVSERIHEFVEAVDGKTEYTQWDTFGGPFYYGWLVYGLFGQQIVRRMSESMPDLKAYIESNRKVYEQVLE